MFCLRVHARALSELRGWQFGLTFDQRGYRGEFGRMGLGVIIVILIGKTTEGVNDEYAARKGFGNCRTMLV